MVSLPKVYQGGRLIRFFRPSWFSSLILVALGVGISGYLLARSFALLEGWAAPDSIDPCSALFRADCDATLLSPSSWQLGIPLAGWGVVFYCILASLLVLERWLGTPFERGARLGQLGTGAVGAVVSLLLAGVMLLGSVPVCPLCLTLHGINLLLLLGFFSRYGHGLGGIRDDSLAMLRYATRSEESQNTEQHLRLLAVVSVIVFAVVIQQAILIEGFRRGANTAASVDPGEILAAYAKSTEQEIPVDERDPVLGSLEAPARMVVFSSFECPGCRDLAGLMTELVRRHQGRLSVVFKHYPLGTSCNDALAVDLHPRACRAARAAWVAGNQGEFWSYHDALYDADWDSESFSFLDLAEKLGFERDPFAVDLESPESLAKVLEDIQLGHRLHVEATPTVFLNGRLVPYLNQRAMEILIREVVKR